MIVTRITTKVHPGCWASETTKAFPNYSITMFLADVDREGYSVFANLIPKQDENPSERARVVSSIGNYGMCQSLSVHPIYDGPTGDRYIIQVKDAGFARGIIRAILEESKAKLPRFQKMTADNGEETIYAVFNDETTMLAVQTRLGGVIGEGLVDFSIINKNATTEDLFKSIPMFFEVIFPPEVPPVVCTMLQDIMIDIAQGLVNPDETWERVERIFGHLGHTAGILALTLEALRIKGILL